MIGCTQPRRVAAITTGRRVAKELNTPLGKEVGYQVRYEKRVGKDTKIKFMTDGILLKELQSDFLLGSYSAIIVDEAHERGLARSAQICMHTCFCSSNLVRITSLQQCTPSFALQAYYRVISEL